jgi:choline monooxygenase
MWSHSHRLPQVLDARCYFDAEHHARELALLFATSWHCVTTLHHLRAPGDFVTLELLGEPVLVRNCGGELRAFQNICPHRNSIIRGEAHGSAPAIRCRYHGWEFDDAGCSKRIPDAKSFVPLARGQYCLERFRAAACGELVFVSLAPTGAPLREALGEVTWQFIEGAFSTDYRLTSTWTIEHAANWKIIVENALEGYHVTDVHPRTFGQKLSSADGVTHTFGEVHTLLENTRLPTGGLLHWIARQWRSQPHFRYGHLHGFPSLLVAYTDISSLAQLVIPTSPTTARSLVWSFVHRGDGRTLRQRALAPLVTALVERFTRQVMREDNAVFPGVQRGLESTRHPGVLGAREERLHAFQQYVASRVA